MSDKMSEYISDRISGGMPDTISDRMLEYMSDRLPDRMPPRMSGRMPDRMSDRIPESVCVSIYFWIYATVGTEAKYFVCYDHPGKDSNLRVSHQAWMMVACRTGGKWKLAWKTFVWCATFGVASCSGPPSVSFLGPKTAEQEDDHVSCYFLTTTYNEGTTHYTYYPLPTTTNYLRPTT